ncbi:MAG: Lrp/AsnC family transcriptional regulator [Desulfosarcina sp.]|nr:Lrp/AsnC family transcriptional regulator [Desulfosarcina sp.]MBC2743467.1 Lrp/AsnC family transcriptional regulator [Desulfosarcina sp.]MBC2766377.1 Lrp/AsnC family transcriptional regulator [Desulfosarcina sp.]
MRDNIDEVDSKIIHLLKKNGRTPNTELAKKLKISETAIRKRLKRLFDNEIIQVVAVVNHRKIGYKIDGNIKIKIDTKKTEQIIRELEAIDDLWYIALLTGGADFDVEFSVKSQGDLRGLLADIYNIDGVINAEPSFRLQLVKNRYDWETPKAGAMPM